MFILLDVLPSADVLLSLNKQIAFGWLFTLRNVFYVSGGFSMITAVELEQIILFMFGYILYIKKKKKKGNHKCLFQKLHL